MEDSRALVQSECKRMTPDWMMRCAWQFVGSRVRRSFVSTVDHHAARACFARMRALLRFAEACWPWRLAPRANSNGGPHGGFRDLQPSAKFDDSEGSPSNSTIWRADRQPS